MKRKRLMPSLTVCKNLNIVDRCLLMEARIRMPLMSMMMMPLSGGLNSRSVQIQTLLNNSAVMEKCCVQHRLTTRIDYNTPWVYIWLKFNLIVGLWFFLWDNVQWILVLFSPSLERLLLCRFRKSQDDISAVETCRITLLPARYVKLIPLTTYSRDQFKIKNLNCHILPRLNINHSHIKKN